MPKLAVDIIPVRLRLFDILDEAVTSGIAFGWIRAHRHDDAPSPDSVKECLRQEIMAELDSIIDFDHGRVLGAGDDE